MKTLLGVTAALFLVLLTATPLVARAQSPTLVVNVTAKVTGDADSGYCGYWAVDSYKKHIQIWALPNGDYQVSESFVGTSTTTAGVPSPDVCTVLESTTATASLQGTESFVISGTFAPSATSTHGFIGSFDYGTVPGDLGPYGSHSVNPTYVDMLTFYFPSGFSYPAGYPSPFSFVYHYQSQTWTDESNVPQAMAGNIVV